MPTEQSLQWITLADFSPGIYSDWRSSSTYEPAPDGAAQLTGTLGCVARPSGGLIPGPRVVNSYQENFSTLSSDYGLSGSRNKAQIIGFRNISAARFGGGGHSQPIVALKNGQPVGASATYPDVLAISTQICFSSGSVDNLSTRPAIYKFANGYLTKTFLLTQGDFATPSANIASPYGQQYWAIGRTNETAPTSAGSVVIASGIGIPEDGYNLNNLGYPSDNASCVYPDPQTPFHESVRVIESNNSTISGVQPTYAFNMIGHQGRLLYIPSFGNYSWLGMGTGLNSNEAITATPSNQWTGFPSIIDSVFVEDNPSGIGAWASMNASELFIIKRLYGGYVIRVDLANPTIVRLPGIPSIYDAQHIPCVYNQSVYYGNRFGVWQWSGGDTAQNISPQLDGWFWKTTTMDEMNGNKGSFAYCYPFLFAPNNFIFDTRTNSWWKFGKPTKRTYNWYSPSSNGNMLCGPEYLSATQNTLVDWFSTTQGAHTFTWRSQPLQKTLQRSLTFRDTSIVCAGVGQIIITATGLNGTTDSFTVNVNSSQPVAFRACLNIVAHDVVIDISSTATSSSNPAPTIYRLSLGYTEGTTVAQSA